MKKPSIPQLIKLFQVQAPRILTSQWWRGRITPVKTLKAFFEELARNQKKKKKEGFGRKRGRG